MANFQKTSWGWQFEQTQHRLGEWLQVKLMAAFANQSIPPGLISTLGSLLWFLLAAGLVWLLYQLMRFYQRTGRRRRPAVTPVASPPHPSTVPELLAQSQAWQSQHNYSEACRYLYLAMLQRLHDASLIPHQYSRTDREYLDLLAQLPVLQNSTELLRTHEQLQFADRSISAAGLDRCQQAYQQLDAQLQQQATSS
jgi:Domain of unknown function (DUF4129)